MQTTGWAIADNWDYAIPLLNEWSSLEADGFPPQPENLTFDQAWYDGWLAGYEAAMLDPLDGFSLYMLFHPIEPLVPEEEYHWDPEPTWNDPMDINPNPLQGYAIPVWAACPWKKDSVPFAIAALFKKSRERERRGKRSQNTESPLEFEGPTLKEPYFEALAALFV